MPRDIGPDMLAHLDAQLAAGRLTPAAHEARKVEVLELIRRGKAVEYSPREVVVGRTMSVLMVVLGLAMVGMVASGAAVWLLLIGVAALFLAVREWRRVSP